MGQGWRPVVINSLTELKSINENVQSLRDKITFLLGGTTNSEAGEKLDYFEYKTTNAGKQHFFHFYHLHAPFGLLPSLPPDTKWFKTISLRHCNCGKTNR